MPTMTCLDATEDTHWRTISDAGSAPEPTSVRSDQTNTAFAVLVSPSDPLKRQSFSRTELAIAFSQLMTVTIVP
jgi:hypothetical protein